MSAAYPLHAVRPMTCRYVVVAPAAHMKKCISCLHRTDHGLTGARRIYPLCEECALRFAMTIVKPEPAP